MRPLLWLCSIAERLAMNVYDFDGTIYKGDSSLDFFIFCIKKQPLLLRYLPVQIGGILGYVIGLYDKARMKQSFFSFLRGVLSVQETVGQFWLSHRRKIAEWYLGRRKSNDVVISASPEFLLRPVCLQLGIGHVIATKVMENNGRLASCNCKGAEKARRFLMEYEKCEIEEFYSDSLSDLPLARLAKVAFLVEKGELTTWNIHEK